MTKCRATPTSRNSIANLAAACSGVQTLGLFRYQFIGTGYHALDGTLDAGERILAIGQLAIVSIHVSPGDRGNFGSKARERLSQLSLILQRCPGRITRIA